MQFKEVKAADLRYMDPAAKEAAANMRQALGSEYAGGCTGAAGLALALALVLLESGVWVHGAERARVASSHGAWLTPLSPSGPASHLAALRPAANRPHRDPHVHPHCVPVSCVRAAAMRMEAAPHEGNKMAKRKHQIGTLFFNAKMKELEILEGKATALKTKNETARKYGW